MVYFPCTNQIYKNSDFSSPPTPSVLGHSLQMSDHNPKEPNISALSDDVTELVLSFLFEIHNTNSKNNQFFAFDPVSNSRFRLPHFHDSNSSFLSSNCFFFTTTPRFSYNPILKSALKYSRINPLLGVLVDGEFGFKFIVVGGVRLISGLVDIEDRLAVEIYDLILDSWELCPPLLADYRFGNSSQSLSLALFKSRFYVFGIYSGFISYLDLQKHVWSRCKEDTARMAERRERRKEDRKEGPGSTSTMPR